MKSNIFIAMCGISNISTAFSSQLNIGSKHEGALALFPTQLLSFELISTVDQGYNKYVNKFKSLSNHKIAMHYGKTRYQRMILYHQNVSESL